MRRTSIIIVCLILLTGCNPSWVGKGFPKAGEAEIEVRGLDSSIRIDYDDLYIPHVHASSETGAMFALGYAMAGQRLFQMDVMRQTAHGRLSEFLGEAVTLTQGGEQIEIPLKSVDYYLKILDFTDSGKRLLARSGAQTRFDFDAFAQGVNAFVHVHEKKLSAPYSIPRGLGGKTFKKWSAADSAAIMMLAAWSNSKNVQEETFAIQALQGGATSAQIVDLLSPAREIDPTPYAYLDEMAPLLWGMNFVPGVERLRQLEMGTLLSGADVAGSNNWVVAGKRTRSGKPILANDPHLGRRLPTFWYFAHLRCPEMDAAGAFVPGVPIMPIGHNGTTAWGVTVSMADVTDLTIESVNPDLKAYEQNGRWYPLRAKDVWVGAADKREKRTVYATPNGPLITRLDGGVKAGVSLRWAGWDATTGLDGALELMRAPNVDAAMRAASKIDVVSLNMVFADRDDNIGWVITGAIPERGGFTGLVPRDGRIPTHGWRGVVPYNQRPSAKNPDSGYIVTANNRPESPLADNVSQYYSAHYRYQRIDDLLRAGGAKLSIDDMRLMQNDQRSMQAEVVLPYVLAIRTTDEDEVMVINALKKWDRHVRRDSRGALYYMVFITEFSKVVLEDLPQSARKAYTDRSPFYYSPVDALGRQKTALWSDDAERDRAIRTALKRTATFLRSRFGENLPTAMWGDLHRLVLRHPLAGASVIGGKYEVPVLAEGGSSNTVSVGGFRLGTTYDMETYPSLRFLVDMARPDQARIALPGGQSEIPNHPSYIEMLDDWDQGRDRALLYSPGDLEREPTPASVVLVPVRK
ncbi:MAG: penicillin acylase family protein [Deltaproteobacteria bacterium]|nr:penicillin acylase family protein [Deltaproteobacteria bacterium]